MIILNIFLNSYRPICLSKQGKSAIINYNLPKYIDGSVRREPDFESDYVGISATCRGKKFAPRLHENDIIVYITKKERYNKTLTKSHWMLTSILEVIHRFETHQEAANWYMQNNFKIPSNCMIGQPYIPFEQTAMSKADAIFAESVYKDRVKKNPNYLICKPIYKELNNPIVITEEMMKSIFGKPRGTETPPTITLENLNDILTLI